MTEIAKDNFEKGIFWELYKDLENRFRDFLEYVPYLEANENVFSFKLLNLMLSIGGYIDSAFKEMARYPGFSNNKDCQKILRLVRESEENIKKNKAPKTVPIWLPLRAFEKEYQLSRRKVLFKRLPSREKIMPFKAFHPKTRAPEWWEIYNALKHNVGINYRKATLQNVRNALAGAFLLNAIHIPSAVRLARSGIVKPCYENIHIYNKLYIGPVPLVIEDWLKKERGFWGFVETPLFICNLEELL